jgi:hypothetical protein
MVQINEQSFPDRPNVTTFSGSYNGTELLVTVTSNTTGNATFGNYTLTFALTSENESISVAEIDVSDGSHISVSADSERSLEFSIFPNDRTGDVMSFGFFKLIMNKHGWWEVVLPIGIALLLTFLLRHFCPEVF